MSARVNERFRQWKGDDPSTTMGAHQLKKLAQSRTTYGHNHAHHAPHKWTDYLPRHWSVYTLVCSTASLALFCFLFYDLQSSTIALVVQAGRQMDALKAQVGDSYLFASTSASETGVVADHVTAESDHQTTPRELQQLHHKEDGDQLQWSRLDPKALLNEADLEQIRSEFDELDKLPPSSASTAGRDRTVAAQEVAEENVQEFKDSEEVDEAKTESELESGTSASSEDDSGTMTALEGSASEDVEIVDPVPQWKPTDDTDFADVETVEEMIAAIGGDALVEETPEVIDSTCDWTKGKWVYDESYPLYQPNTCPFVDGGFRCVENGRPSSEFQKWRWQPHGCNLPRFDAKDMLERLRGSRMVFVGDSIGRNNWESMLCMLSSVVANKSRVYEINGEAITKHSGFLIYRFEDYDCTVEYYRAPHLVPQGRGPPNSDPRVRSTLKLDTMDWSNSKWRTADIVIFNTGHWWNWGKTIRGGCYFQEGQQVHLNMTVHEAFTRAMRTVARFVEENMDPSKSQVFFRSYAPVHFRGGTWDHGGHCNGDEKPLQKFPFIWEDKTPSPMISGVMAANVRTPIHFLNVTYLSDLRPDGHSSMYQRVPPSPMNHQDCSHWCLPGVPDTWNEILLATLLKNAQGKWGSLDQDN